MTKKSDIPDDLVELDPEMFEREFADVPLGSVDATDDQVGAVLGLRWFSIVGDGGSYDSAVDEGSIFVSKSDLKKIHVTDAYIGTLASRLGGEEGDEVVEISADRKSYKRTVVGGFRVE